MAHYHTQSVHVAEDAKWELWYQDTFDRACPRRLEQSGRGLVSGLVELWKRHLFETVQADGTKGFSRFNLWWKQAGLNIKILGHWEGMCRLRAWMFRSQQGLVDSYQNRGDRSLLMAVASVHVRLIMAGHSSERILEMARDAENRKEFEHCLFRLSQETNMGLM